VFDVFVIIILFFAFGVIHSVLASAKIKLKIKSYAGNLMAFYRLAYVTLSLLSFYLIYLISPQPRNIVYDLNYPFDFIILVPQFLALGGIIWALKYFCIKEFLGINQVLRWINGNYNPEELDEQMTLIIGGPYKYIRHPLYFFTILFLLFRPEMDLFYLTSFVCITAYFFIGSFYEEKKLVEKFGESYIKYQGEVSRLFPSGLFSAYMSKIITENK
jgi:protein-S-isoprenylcysteine O-methyltransferase Ste14